MTQYPELRVPNAENYVSRDLAIIFTSEWAFLYHYPDSIWALITYKGTAERWSNRYPFDVNTHGYAYHDLASYRFAGAICRGEFFYSV